MNPMWSMFWFFWFISLITAPLLHSPWCGCDAVSRALRHHFPPFHFLLTIREEERRAARVWGLFFLFLRSRLHNDKFLWKPRERASRLMLACLLSFYSLSAATRLGICTTWSSVVGVWRKTGNSGLLLESFSFFLTQVVPTEILLANI